MKPISEYTQEECESAIKSLNRKHSFTKTIEHYTDEIDAIVNELLDLEKRIDYLKMMDNVSKANEVRWGKNDETP